MDYEWKEIKSAFLFFVVMAVLLGLVYPLVMTGIAQVAFPTEANGSLIEDDNGTIIGSERIGQAFTSPQYFYGRPSHAGSENGGFGEGYQAEDSGASNWGPMSEDLLTRTNQTVKEIREREGLSPNTPIPADLIFASGSGLDAHISVEAAELQVSRIANERNISEAVVKDLIKEYTELQFPYWGVTPLVNVLKLNIALDKL